MKEVKPFLLRIDPRVLAAVQRWAEADAVSTARSNTSCGKRSPTAA